MNLFTRRSTLQIVTPRHMPPYLRQELASLGYPILEETPMGITTQGSLKDAMRLNLHLRTAHRVLFGLEELRVDSPEELYRELRRIAWEKYIHEDGYLSVNSHVEHSSITDSRLPNLKAKDAIVDRIAEKRGRRPDSGPDRTGAVVYLYWKGDACSVYLDTSGESLANRGYRKLAFQAPMQESLAAAVLMATGWKAGENFVSPMCGSGTLAIEAALIASNVAPGSLRQNFGFMHIQGWDPAVWNGLLRVAEATVREPTSRIVASDIDAEAIRVARRNAELAGVESWIEFDRFEFQQAPVPPSPGVVVLNPPYGERMGQLEPLQELYRSIGDTFKQRYQGYRGYVFTGNADLAKAIGLKAKRRIPFFNTTIECRLLEYELYGGSRKRKLDPDLVNQ